MKFLAWPLLAALLVLAACTAPPVERPADVAVAPETGSTEDMRQAAADVALELPATFSGTLPCADCPGIRVQLTLRRDGVFQLRRDWLERDFSLSDLGIWRHDPQRGTIALDGDRDEPLQFEVRDPRTIRLLDTAGRTIASELPYALHSEGRVYPFALRLRGEFSYMADAARLRVCGADRSWPVAMEAGYLELERAYLALPRSTPGTPWTVVLDAHIEDRAVGEGDALVPAVIVERLVAAADEQACVQTAAVPLAGTYWRALVLDGEPTVMVEGHEEPHLILRADDARYAATAGCNRLMGAWHSDGERIEFSSGASTMMACWPPLDAQEMRLKQVLQDASRWRIDGQTLEFSDAGGRVIAVFEAVYLR